MNSTEFLHPPIHYRTRPLWFWNDRPTKENISEIMENSKELSMYGGVGILAYDACGLQYMSEEYLDAYRIALEKAKELGLKICLYDEWWFPSGGAGGLLKQKYPDACAKRLDKIEYSAENGVDVELPAGTIMAVTAMNAKTLKIMDLSGYVHDGRLIWNCSEPGWKVLIFTCVQDEWDHVNYLDPNSVKRFIEITHDVYYKHFKEYFGDVIDSTFYDEPQFYTCEGRMWTDDFNQKFMLKYNFDPSMLYPALWYDIGNRTSYARNLLFGFRADLYSQGFPKVIQEWCTDHGIELTGHVDQEEVLNPVGIIGDLMKAFKYQSIPGFDEISSQRRGSKIYKIVSSAAYNWDKPLVMSECFGAMSEDISEADMYKEVMEQYSKGMNLLVPHAIWLNPDKEKVVFPPELSYRNKRYVNCLGKFNEYCARVQYLLQGGRHVADIAVLYPIHTLTEEYCFDWGGNPYLGGFDSDLIDYQDIGEMLSTQIRKDFSFIHPEVFDRKCEVRNNKLRLNNEMNFEEFKIIILPGCSTMSVSNAKKLLEFYNQGGMIIATKLLPVHSIEAGGDNELKKIVECVFGKIDSNACEALNMNVNNGRAYFLRNYTKETIDSILCKGSFKYDVEIDCNNPIHGVFSYIHKTRENSEIYFFSNASDEDLMPKITIASTKRMELWNPHDGMVQPINSVSISADRVELNPTIPANSSIFLISA